MLLAKTLLVELYRPRSRHPKMEIAGGLFAVFALTYLMAAVLRRLPPDVSRQPDAFIPNPLQLIPAVIFLIALFGYRRRKYLQDSGFDKSVYLAVWLNLAAQLAACQSIKLLDGPFVFAQSMSVMSYAILDGGALFEVPHIFGQVR